jgi:hypothetical protein
MHTPRLAVTAFAAALAAAMLAGCQTLDAPESAAAYDISGFLRVASSDSVDVIVKRGPFSVTANSSNGSFDELVLERRGDTLVAGTRSIGWFRRMPHFTVTVSAPAYTGFAASSSSSIRGENLSATNVAVKADSSAEVVLGGLSGSLKIETNSSGSVKATDLELTAVEAQASSSSDIMLSGVCDQLTVSVSSSAEFGGADLKCETVTARASTSGQADVWASIAARGVASESGSVLVRGQPGAFDKETSTSGSVRKF